MSQEIKMRVLKDFDVLAPREMIEKVSVSDAVWIGEWVAIGALPKSFKIESSALKLIHIMWLKKKHPSMVMSYNKKTGMVHIDLDG